MSQVQGTAWSLAGIGEAMTVSKTPAGRCELCRKQARGC